MRSVQRTVCITAAQHINFIFRKRDLGTQNPLHENAGKFQDIQGFQERKKATSRKRPMQGTPGNSSLEPKWAFREDFLWRMRTAKVDMLGTREVCAIAWIGSTTALLPSL